MDHDHSAEDVKIKRYFAIEKIKKNALKSAARFSSVISMITCSETGDVITEMLSRKSMRNAVKKLRNKELEGVSLSALDIPESLNRNGHGIFFSDMIVV